MNPAELVNQLHQLNRSVGTANANARAAMQQLEHSQARVAQLEATLQAIRSDIAQNAATQNALQNALSRVQVAQTQGDPNIQRIENVPGRRIPFDCLVEIPIAANSVDVQQQTFIVPQHGPFVATARYATLLSTLQYQLLNENGNVISTFQGRSYGRFRPVSSAWDLNDGQIIDPVIANGGAPAFPGTGAPYLPSVPSTATFRSMGGDFRINFEEEGGNIVRQNKPVPSTFWSKGVGDPVELPCLDFFARGSVLKWSVQPTRPLNPSFGNAFGFTGGGSYPFVTAQYDGVEGIVDTIVQQNTTDRVVRAPNAVLILGLFGYIIWQPAGAGPY